MFKAELYKQVAKYYNKLDAKEQRRVNTAIEEIVKKPFGGPHIKKLKGSGRQISLRYRRSPNHILYRYRWQNHLCRGYWTKRGCI